LTLPKEAREAIARAVGRLRSLFEEEFSDQAKGRFGFHVERQSTKSIEPSGADDRTEGNEVRLLRPWVEPLSALSLSPSQIGQRAELIGALLYLRQEGLDGGEAVARLVREAAFTAVNRLLAVRVAEVIGVFPEVTTRGRQSASYREVTQELFPLLAQAEDEGFWRYLQVAGDELGASVPLLFDRRVPLSAFVPSRACIDAALTILNDDEVAGAWSDPEALGWAYQFFNGDDVRLMREAAPVAPRNPHELAVRNQFFSPRYVVDWLVQNTLGLRLREAGSQIDLPLLVSEPAGRIPLDLNDVTVLDPACGSGHFLLGCYDLLEQAWGERGVAPGEAAETILSCLFGIEIDSRASQVAQAVLVLRARRSAPATVIAAPSIVTAMPLPGDPDARTRIFGQLTSNARDLAEIFDEALSGASSLGGLLKVEERLGSGIARVMAAPKLASDASQDSILTELVTALEHVVSEAGSSPSERMFAADARDAIRFVELCRRRYDVVLMNPPFGEPIPDTREYIRSAYGKSGVDLYAAFVDRGVGLTKPGGYVGAITSRTGFFVDKFDGWRSTVAVPHLVAVCDLGIGVMHGAMVEAAAYVLSSSIRPVDADIRVIDAESADDKAARVYSAPDPSLVSIETLQRIPGTPLAYWLGDRLAGAFTQSPALGSHNDVQLGASTKDDFRFLRLWWEVPPSSIGEGARWMYHVKGGEFSPFANHVHLVIEWENEGERIAESVIEKYPYLNGNPEWVLHRNERHRDPGVTWSARSQKGFSARPVPSSCIFGNKGPMVFVRNNDPADLYKLMGYLNSRVAVALIESLSAFGSFEVGVLQRVPLPDLTIQVGESARKLAEVLTTRYRREETSPHFVSPLASLHDADDPNELGRLCKDLEHDAAGAFGLFHAPNLRSLEAPCDFVAMEWREVNPPTAEALVSYLVGCLFGRWQIGWLLEGNLPPPVDPLASLRPRPLGALAPPTAVAPDTGDYEHPLLFVDEPGSVDDIAGRLHDLAHRLHEDVIDRLGPLSTEAGLRDFLRRSFCKFHLKQYSASRRYAPIYWYLAIPSREWGIWLYAPALTREGLFAITRRAAERLRRVRLQAGQAHEAAHAAPSRDHTDQVERLERLAAELEDFVSAADAVAQSGWTPELNDGIVLCATPLEPLFVDDRWRQEVAKHRKLLEKGGYPWASVQHDYFKVGA
jgi:hypothetical protein